MKKETIALLEKFHDFKRYKFVDSDKGLELEHDLTDEEKMELVTAEYGKSPLDVDALFIKIMRQLIGLAAKQAKIELQDKLSDL